MKYDEIIDQVVEILKGHKEHFLTAYQICQQIEATHPSSVSYTHLTLPTNREV